MNTDEPLHVRYRPSDLDEVVGQDAVVRSLQAMFTAGKGLPHTFLFTGPSGCGKTTLGRIVASNLGVDAQGLTEIDAARFSGVEQMRAMIDRLQYAGMGANKKRAVIVDECHRLSKQTWDTLLLSTEEPPAHLYWIFCTTEPSKVPKTIHTRARTYDVKPVKWDVLADYLQAVAGDAGVDVKEEFIALAARKANGSVRQGLQFLGVLNGIIDKEAALQLLDDYETSEAGPVELARMLVSGQKAKWEHAVKLLAALQEADVQPETVRMTVLGYTSNALMKTTSERGAGNLLAVLQAFSVPFNPAERYAPLLLAVGSLMLG